MCDAMIHRGPDDSGFESRGSATVGVRRLAIFDPANGHQPMVTPDGRFTVVFNGAIYNFRALRDELSSTGTVFHTHCDTEVLLGAWERWGEGCLGRLRGMFAFAIWDALSDTLFLARDPFGIKPLYYRSDGGRLIFCSEIGSMIAGGVFTAEVDPMSVADYLSWFAVPAPWTIYRGVFSLQPGELGVFRGGRLEMRTFWAFDSACGDAEPCATQGDFTRELRRRLEDSIRSHIAADVPVGAFLSGGLDSAAVVGLMSRATGSRLRTFSIGFEEAGYSEAGPAEATARHFGTEHQTRILTGAEVAGGIGSFLSACDQPTGDGVNSYYVSQTARAGGVTVALSGLGGDELFGGYPSFRDLPRLARWLPWWRTLPEALRAPVLERLGRGATRGRKLADFLRLARDMDGLNALQRRVFAAPQVRALLSPEVRAAVGDRPAFHPGLDRLKLELQGRGDFERISAWELRTYMADVLLRDSDVMSMRHSLEMRVPLVDRPLYEWLSRQPAAWKDTPRHPKGALAAAVEDLLPPGFSGRRKQGFTLPFPHWMRHELRPFVEETFSRESVARSGLFAPEATRALWGGFLSGGDTREWSRVWSLAVLVDFVNRRLPVGRVDRPGPAAAAAARGGAAPFNRLQAQPAPVSAAPPRDKRAGSLVMLLAPEIFSSMGGITRMLRLYLKALCELAGATNRGVRLVTLNDPMLDSGDLRRYADDSLEDWYVSSRDKSRFVRAAIKRSRSCRVLVCGHISQLPVAWAARLVNGRLRYYLVAHGIEVWRPFTLMERLALRGATRILCVSDYTRGELLKRCGVREDRVQVLPNALDPGFEIRPGTASAVSAPVIATVSRLSYADRYKGVEHLIKAMPAVRGAVPGARLLVAGRGDDLPRLQGIAHQLGLISGGAIEFLGSIPDSRLDELLGSCRVFALPSENEGFGLVYLEAMARGRPCIGARSGATPEIITDGTGMLVDYGNITQIAEACASALRREWPQEPMLDRARQFSYPIFRQRLGAALNF
jgi:asparagine synthase (glutamine-hydrolysing)